MKMIFVIILIIFVAVIIIAKKSSDQEEAERIEREKRVEQERARKEMYETLTASEKQKLKVYSEETLSTTVNALNKAKHGDSNAMLLLAITYQAKLQNPSKSFYWMQKSSNAGNAEAMYWLGEFYVSGYGVSENRIKGVSTIMDAAKKGNKQAIQSLKETGMSEAEMRSIGIPV